MEFLRRYRVQLCVITMAVLLGVTLSIGCSAIARAQSGPQSADAILQLNIGEQARMVAVANDLAVSRYKLDWSNWNRNVDLLITAKQPAADEPKPPVIRLLDVGAFTAAFQGYFTRCVANSAVGAPCGEFDASAAFITESYPALKRAVTKPVPSQPANPVGASMGAGYYAAAPGDLNPDGFVYTNPVGVRFRKYVIPSPFGAKQWYQAIE